MTFVTYWWQFSLSTTFLERKLDKIAIVQSLPIPLALFREHRSVPRTVEIERGEYEYKPRG